MDAPMTRYSTTLRMPTAVAVAKYHAGVKWHNTTQKKEVR